MDEGGEVQGAVTEEELPFDHDWQPGQPIPRADDERAFPVEDVEAETRPFDGEAAEQPQVHIPTPEEAEALNNSEPAPQAEAQPPLVTEAAFLVYLDGNGHWCGDSAQVNRQVIITREAGLNDYRHACADMSSDLLAAETATRAAQATMQMQQQVMMQALQQRQAQEIGEKIGIPGGGVDLAELQRRTAMSQAAQQQQKK